MGFLTPAAFGLAALIPIIIAMYLLKLRRTEQVVSSVYLWRRMVRDVEANAPWQRLRRNLLLILQLLFLAVLILALTRPFTWAEGSSGRSLILILDTSASMASADVGPSRLEAAKAQARQLADGLPDDARVSVIVAGVGAQVLVDSSMDRRQVHLAIESVKAGTGGSDLTAALELASAVAARQQETEIVVLSDGRVALPDRLSVEGRVRYLPVGVSGDNQAISVLSLEAASAGGGLTAFVQVANYAGSPAQRRLTLYADGQLINAYDLEIPPFGQRAVAAKDLAGDTRLVEARLAGQDTLPLDDRAWAVHRSTAPAAVTLVSGGNLFLETALALLPGLEVTVVKPEDWKAERLPGQSSDHLTIFDAYVPITATTPAALSTGLPAGNLLFIAPPRSTGYFTVTGTVEQPLPLSMLGGAEGEAADPLLAHVDLAEVGVLEAVRIPLPAWARAVIVTGDSIPLLLAGEVDGRRVAVLAFDLHRSDLPLQVAFPILLANLVGWLTPGSSGGLPTQVAPGAAVTLAWPPEVESVKVTRPDGSTVRLVPEGGRAAFADTVQLGVYEAAWQRSDPAAGQEDERANFAVNLFSPQESDVRPAEALPLAGMEGTGEGERPQQARREWWRPLALAALTLLMIEWLVYQRAALVRIWTRVKRQG
ncbi:MAG: BatA and WFA domain-containing protein [Anaerolineae bacterium]|nr:MAG: BatA and WFA domain-containing protein [Anaerolineae bacterium]